MCTCVHVYGASGEYMTKNRKMRTSRHAASHGLRQKVVRKQDTSENKQFIEKQLINVQETEHKTDDMKITMHTSATTSK